jgi:hypothetical protein
MSFKNLNLDRNKIDVAIQEWAGLNEKIEPIKKGNGYHYSVPKEDEQALLIIYFKNDGTCTINPTAGKYPELSKQLAEYLKENCLITKRKNFSLTFRNVSDDNFSLLMDFLIDELNSKILEDDKSETRRLLRIKGQFEDEIAITYYNNETVLVQGKPLNLYTEIKLFFYEILSFEQVVQTEAETYEIDIKTADIRNELESYLPTAFSFLDDRIIKIITPSLSLMKLEIELEDYSSFAFPALRGLEGYIRQLLRVKGNEDGVKKVNKIGSLFQEDDNKFSYLMDFAKSDIQCDDTCQALEEAYNFWRSKRHPYFHTDGHVQMTPIIWKKEA